MTILTNSTGRRSVLAAVTVLLAVTASLSGCGTVPGRSAASSRTSARITAADQRTDVRIKVAAAGSPAEANAVATHLLAELVLTAPRCNIRSSPSAVKLSISIGTSGCR
jgi:hypothetical protein